MRFNQNSSCIDFLDNKKLGNYQMNQRSWHEIRKLQFQHELQGTFATGIENFAKDVKYITKPFYEAYVSTKDKLDEVLKGTDLGTGTGTLILPAFMTSSGGTKTIFYHYRLSKGKLFNFIAICFYKSKDHQTVLDFAININAEHDRINYYIDDSYLDQNIQGKSILSDIVGIITFLRVCPIQEKIIEPKQKLREFNCKYFNETKQRINIIDSTWFTSIVISPKGRRGHWKLQPCGENSMDRKLIWIDPIENIKPYTRKAKSLNQNDHG